ncbi:MAG: MFS transporter [Promethearchaeota archaeon]|nr:MAG: MFS transporter [Candidatus Lokiarchaeota archaeon]
MSETNIQVYGSRWKVLLLFMFINITMQILWITFASITIEAAGFYEVAELDILLLSLVFMIAYIPVTFLASWIIDKYDFRIGAGIGAVLAGIFGFLRFFAGNDYTLVLIFQIGIAIGQPFILNSITRLSANWFPESERTTATGLSMISQFIGIMLGVLITPFIFDAFDIPITILIYGILALISGACFVIFTKNKPPTPPSIEISKEKVLMGQGLKQIFVNRYFIILFVTFFFGLGIFNFITSYIELIVAPRGFDPTEAGILGGLMLIGGIVGCVIMSALSDKYKKRKILLIISIIIATISLSVITFSADPILLYLFSFLLGYGILSAGPVALEYAVDLTEPVPEATSNGLLLMIGQVGGIIFILFFEGFTTPLGDYFPTLLLESIFLLIVLIMVFFLKEKSNLKST